MKLLVDIRRDPGSGKPPYDQTFELEADPGERLISVLMRIKVEQDGTLSFRYSCAHGICGSDAMRVNGREALACKSIVDTVAVPVEGATGVWRIRVEPLRHMKVQRDLMMDQEDFFERSMAVKPFFLPVSKPADREMVQSQEDRELYDDASKCINCGACFSACPVLEKNPRFIGPAAIVQAARFAEDSRDLGLEPRLDALDAADAVWGCENHFECTRVCPREIKVTKIINLMKRRVTQAREARGEATQAPPAGGA